MTMSNIYRNDRFHFQVRDLRSLKRNSSLPLRYTINSISFSYTVYYIYKVDVKPNKLKLRILAVKFTIGNVLTY